MLISENLIFWKLFEVSWSCGL